MRTRKRTPDRLETGLRLGCGGLFGLLLGVVALGRFAFRVGVPTLAYVGIPVLVVVCALAAWRLGDDFYHRWSDGEFMLPTRWTLTALGAALLALVLWMWWRNGGS
ncbi:MAG: hypothetical protein JNM10_08610 [Planctomycetia bacterium]|nr:hypothetical protein [Planctomycetia bacterium]